MDGKQVKRYVAAGFIHAMYKGEEVVSDDYQVVMKRDALESTIEMYIRPKHRENFRVHLGKVTGSALDIAKIFHKWQSTESEKALAQIGRGRIF